MGLKEAFYEWRTKKQTGEVSELITRANALIEAGKYDEAFELMNTASKLSDSILNYTIKRAEENEKKAQVAFDDLMKKLDGINAKQMAQLDEANKALSSNPFANH